MPSTMLASCISSSFQPGAGKKEEGRDLRRAAFEGDGTSRGRPRASPGRPVRRGIPRSPDRGMQCLRARQARGHGFCSDEFHGGTTSGVACARISPREDWSHHGRLPPVTTPPETRYATASDGLKIAYQVTGSRDLDLVFMQGAVAHLELAWEDPRLSRLFERLSSFTRLIRFDRRGMGMSGVTDRPSTLEEQVGDFAAVMDAVGAERAALFGTIDAGTIALAFAAEHPERTAAVIAFETAPRWTRTGEDDFGVEPEVLARFAEATQAMDVDGQLSIVAPSRKDDPAFRSWFRQYTRSAQSGIPIQVVMMVMMSWDIRDRLPAIEAPVLVINRAEHAILPVRNARALAAALPKATLVELPGRDTAIFSSDVDAVADEIEAFLTGSRPPPRHDRVLATVLFTDIVGST